MDPDREDVQLCVFNWSHAKVLELSGTEFIYKEVEDISRHC